MVALLTRSANVVYFQPHLNAGRNYRNGLQREQIWCPWWALLLHQHVAPVLSSARLVDARCDPKWPETLASTLTNDSILAVSVMTGHAIRGAITASELAKQAGARVFWGGPHATLFPHEVAAEAFVDHVIAGYGGRVFGQSVQMLMTGSSPPDIIDGRGTLGPTPVTTLKGPIVSVELKPALELVGDWQNYVNADQAIGDRSVNLVTSEGCLRRCTYCSEPTTSRHSWLTYDVDDCAKVAHQVVDLSGANGVKLHDPNFLHDVVRGLRFARLLSSASPTLSWAATIHPADLLKLADADLDELSKSGLRRVLVGLESPIQKIVDLAGKRYDVSRIAELGEKLARHGIAGMFTFIVGWPDADASHYQATIDAAYNLRQISPTHQAKIHFLEPWPGTPLYTMLSRRSAMPQRSLTDWADIDYYFAHLPKLHATEWEQAVRVANEELSPYVEA